VSEQRAHLAERYGAPNRARKPLVVAGTIVLAVAGIGWLVWVIAFHGSPQAQSQLLSFDIAGQHAVHARLTVVRSEPDVQASCLLRAIASDHSIVGELDFTVGPAPATSSTLSKSVRTERRATTVELLGCVAPGQQQRR
jgi:hypothetical protein